MYYNPSLARRRAAAKRRRELVRNLVGAAALIVIFLIVFVLPGILIGAGWWFGLGIFETILVLAVVAAFRCAH